MLLVALKHIPGTISIEPGQTFIEPNDEQRQQWLLTGFARPLEMAVPVAPDKPDRKGLPDWAGGTVVIIASGPSLTEEQCAQVADWHAALTLAGAAQRRVIVINSSYVRAPFADVLYACDGNWWRAARNGEPTNAETVLATWPQHKLWTQDVNAAKEFGLNLIRSTAGVGLSRKPGLIHQGMNSAYQCINFAFLAGARRILLLGVDCKGGHWHGNHPAPLSNNLPHAQWLKKFEPLARDLTAEGIEVVNCSPGSALKVFPYAPLSEELL